MLGLDQRLVAKGEQDAVQRRSSGRPEQSSESQAQGRTHAAFPIGVLDDPDIQAVQLALRLRGARTENDDHRVAPRLQDDPRRAAQQTLPLVGQELFGRTQPGRAARRQKDGTNAHGEKWKVEAGGYRRDGSPDGTQG